MGRGIANGFGVAGRGEMSEANGLDDQDAAQAVGNLAAFPCDGSKSRDRFRSPRDSDVWVSSFVKRVGDDKRKSMRLRQVDHRRDWRNLLVENGAEARFADGPHVR